MRKSGLIQFVPLLAVFLILSCTARQNDELVHFGPDETTDLVFFFRKDTPRKEIENFLMKDGLVSPSQKGSGFVLPDGMVTGFEVIVNDHSGFGLNYKTDATEQHREAIKQRVCNSPLIYKIYENVRPNEITDL